MRILSLVWSLLSLLLLVLLPSPLAVGPLSLDEEHLPAPLPVVVAAPRPAVAAAAPLQPGLAPSGVVRPDPTVASASIRARLAPAPPTPVALFATFRPEPTPAPAPLLADLLQARPAVVPAYQGAWHGDTPSTRPDLALAFSQAQPEAYAQWLADQLPRGSHLRRVRATVTAYCPCAICCLQRTERTATGRSTNIYPYGIAADWRQLAPGTQVHVPGYLTESTIGGVWEVDDTGGALRRSTETHGILHLDVRFMSHTWAERWGTRRQWVYLVELPPAALADGLTTTAR